jgi:hypothetical protein
MSIQGSLFTSDTLTELGSKKRLQALDALEDFLAPDPEISREGLQTLLELDAVRRSPLVASVLATRLCDPRIEVRARLLEALAPVVRAPAHGQNAADRVRAWLQQSLWLARREDVLAILELVHQRQGRFDDACRLLSASGQAAELLLSLLEDHAVELALKAQAVEMLASIGYLDALPVIERMIDRISARSAAQIGMPFARRNDTEAEVLLPVLKESVRLLREGFY